MKTPFLLIITLLTSAVSFSQNVQSSAKEASYTTLTDFDASQKGSAVQLSWVALNERSMAVHEVQKSTNGSAFRNIGTLTANNEAASSRYTFLDASPIQGNNYYRLRTVDRNGNETFSNIVQLNEGFGRTDLKVLGNPAQAGVLNLQLQNISSGKYFISLYSSAGEKVFARSLDLTDGSLTQTINLPQNLGHGIYFLQVTDGETRLNKQVMF